MNAKYAKYHSLRSVLLLGLCLLAISLSGEALAQSAIQVQITSGDAAPIVLTNPLDFGPVTINGWTIDGLNVGPNYNDTGSGPPGRFGGIGAGVGGTPSCTSYPATCMGLICTASPCTADPLKIEVSATGFTLPVVGFYIEECCEDISAGITMGMAAFLSASDELDMTTTPLASLTLTGPLGYQSGGTFGRGRARPSPYSLTEIDAFTAESTGLYLPYENVTLAAQQPVSEPAPLLLFGGGLLLLAIIRRRRRPAQGDADALNAWRGLPGP